MVTCANVMLTWFNCTYVLNVYQWAILAILWGSNSNQLEVVQWGIASLMCACLLDVYLRSVCLKCNTHFR